MYAYDNFDQTIVQERAAEFREQVKRRLAGELSEEQYARLLKAFVDDMESKIEKMDGEVRNICN